uniref:coiled-coil domain-containing protein 185 n=1 Tax=Myodes glareolus TaxID=447135 RepID=UPI0020205E01|nr:coiled-coil domain-containing protein 185 [Myodes glareolus]
MAGFHLFSPWPYGEFGEPSASGELEFAAPLGWPEPTLSPWARTPVAESETGVPWVHQKCLPTGRPRRRGHTSSPRESRSLTRVARRPSDRTRKHKSGSRRLEEASGEAPTKSSRTWQQQQQQQQDQPYPRYPAAPGDSSPPYPRRAFSPQSVETLFLEKTHNRDRWAVPVCRHVGLWSPSSVLTDKSSAHSLEFRKQSTSVSSQKRVSGHRTESLANQHSQASDSCKEESSQHAQVLKSKLDEAVISSRDHKIVALVLSRLKKAQRMRELQHQAAVAWEELKRSDQKVHLTLERERRLLLQQSQEQWQGQKELHKPRKGHEQLRQGQEPVLRQDRQEKSTVQSESGSGLREPPDDPPENDRGVDKLDRAHAQAEHLKQCQEQRLREQEKALQGLRDLKRLQLQKRMETACHKRQQHLAENQRKVQDSNLSSVVNFQARKVLMDSQAKAEELLRKLSLEQSFQRSQDIQESLAKERHLEQRGKAQGEAEQFQRVRRQVEEAEERLMSKQVLAELAEQKIRQARGHAHKTTRDRAQHLQELNILRERNHHVLKLKAEKEEKCHIEGIKEAIKKKEQRAEQMTRGKDPIFQEFQKVPPASKTDRCFDYLAAEAQLPIGQQSGIY